MNIVYLGYLIPFAEALMNNPNVSKLTLGYEPNLPKGSVFYKHFQEKRTDIINASNVNLNQPIIDACIDADVVVVGAFSQILKSEMIEHCLGKIVNFHPSNLPSYRGGHPIEHQLLDGVTEAGVTFHRIDNGIDSGGIIFQSSFLVTDNMTYNDFLETAINVGGELLDKVVSISPANWPEVLPAHHGEYRRLLNAEDAVILPEVTVAQARRIIAALGWRNWVTYQGDEKIQFINGVLDSQSNDGVPSKELILCDGRLKVEVLSNE
ncbi:hypothetical protein DS893_05575 [Vibrionales bacterium C3R12]|nr:hypothetical protein DS893_05575 [Vibrionales bacterium C3R12]